MRPGRQASSDVVIWRSPSVSATTTQVATPPTTNSIPRRMDAIEAVLLINASLDRALRTLVPSGVGPGFAGQGRSPVDAGAFSHYLRRAIRWHIAGRWRGGDDPPARRWAPKMVRMQQTSPLRCSSVDDRANSCSFSLRSRTLRCGGLAVVRRHRFDLGKLICAYQDRPRGVSPRLHHLGPGRAWRSGAGGDAGRATAD